MGVMRTPPPTPVSPETRPMPEPASEAATGPGGCVAVSAKSFRKKSGGAASTRSVPKSRLKNKGGRVRYPPSNAAGADAIASGQNVLQSKWPARKKRNATRAETRTFKTKAVGLIVPGANPNRAIAAMEPDAPAWPAQEYRIETKK